MEKPGKRSQQMTVSEATSRLMFLILKMTPEQIFAALEYFESKEGSPESKEGKKRKAERVDYFMNVDYVVGEKRYSGYIKNISTSGIYVETGERFEPGQDVILSFSLPNSSQYARVKGKISRTDDRGIGIAFDVDLSEMLGAANRQPEAFNLPVTE